VPGIWSNPLQKLLPHASLWRQAALGLALAAAWPVRAAEVVVTPTPVAAAPVHLSDEGNRLLKGTLKPEADRRSRANALYAQAMLRLENVASADDQQRAMQLFRQVVELDPDFSDAQLKLANLLLQSGQFDEAHQQLTTLAREHPSSVPVEVELGYTERLRGQNEEAQKLCVRALTADCSQTLAMRVILEVSADQQDLSGGVLRVEDILKAGGANVPATAWLALDRLYLEYARGQNNSLTNEQILRTRLPILQVAVAKVPADADTWTELAKTYRGLGRKLDALAALQRASSLSPTDADLLSHCAELELDLERKDDAIRDYEKAYTINPDLQIIAEDGVHHQALRDLLGRLELDNQRFDAAVALYEKALEGSPQDPNLEIDLGIAYEATHQPDKAQACFQQVFNSASCPEDAYLELAFFQLSHKEIPQAGQTLAAALQRFPQSPWVCYYQALQHRCEKNYDAALASFAQVRSLATGSQVGVLNEDFYIQDALTLELAGKKDQSESVLREGLNHFPDNADLMNELAYFWAEQGSHLQEALALSRRAGALEPDNGPIMDTCGWVYFQMGLVKDSLPYLQRAAVMTNNDPVVLQHVGDALLKLGLKREAIETWTRALEKDPHNGDLTSRIDAAQAQATNVHLRSAPKP
jgi:tetratricopeptide (TPR) repeat protein